MSTPPFELTGSTPQSTAEPLKTTHEKQLLEKPLIKHEKFEYKEKDHKEKDKDKDKEKEKEKEKEHKDKGEHKEKLEKFEHREKIAQIEKFLLLEHPNKDFAGEIIGPGNPVDPEPFNSRIEKLEKTVGDLQHFITTNLRPDLSKGALKQEPEADKSTKK